MRSKLKEYLDIEISGLGVKKGLPRLIYFLKKMRYDPSSNAIFMLRFCDMYQMDGGLKNFFVCIIGDYLSTGMAFFLIKSQFAYRERAFSSAPFINCLWRWCEYW